MVRRSFVVGRLRRCNVCLAAVLLGVLALPLSGAAQEKSGSGGGEDPLMVLQRSMGYLAEMQQFRFVAHIGFDVVQEDGQKIEFGSTREVAVHRPDRFRVNVGRRDGTRSGVVFDGEAITLFNATENVYATESKPGDIDQAVDYLSEELGVPTPLGDLLVADPEAVMAAGIESSWYGGLSIVGGVECDHLAFRTSLVDYQLWVGRGAVPLPWRVKIVYRNAEGQPQFTAQFLEWKKGESLSPSLFTYVPPEGAEKILFAVHMQRPGPSGEAGAKAKGVDQ